MEELTPQAYKNFFGRSVEDIPCRNYDGPIFFETESGQSFRKRGTPEVFVERLGCYLTIGDSYTIGHIIYCAEDGKVRSVYTYASIPRKDPAVSGRYTMSERSGNDVLLLRITDYQCRLVSYVSPITQETFPAELVTATVWRPDRWVERRGRRNSIQIYTGIPLSGNSMQKLLRLGRWNYEVLEQSTFDRATNRWAKREPRNPLWIEVERIVNLDGNSLRYVNELAGVSLSGELFFNSNYFERFNTGKLLLREVNGQKIDGLETECPRDLGKALLIAY